MHSLGRNPATAAVLTHQGGCFTLHHGVGSTSNSVSGTGCIHYSFYRLPAAANETGPGKPKHRRTFRFFSGFVGTLFGTGAPFYVIYMNLRHLDKNSFRATFAAIFLIDGAMRLAGYTANDFYTLEMLMYLAVAVPVTGVDYRPNRQCNV